YRDGAAFYRDFRAGLVRRRRRSRRRLSPGRHGRRSRLHGGARCRTFPGSTGGAPRRGGMIPPPKENGRTYVVGTVATLRDQTLPRQERRDNSSGAVMDWDKLKVFPAAAEAGSFTHAGEQLGLSQSAVSRQVGALEQELSVPLFHRHARGLILTEQ